uniref:Sphingosine-1-phosphate lyase n=1 Tax=Ganoderma boninense TaxID=34458 RepID=A0A5K1K148_9APHY|nr:Sphingosine-1-phosphate lyase [Ganoderma boninense]
MTTLGGGNGYGAPQSPADGNGSADAMANFYNQVTAVQGDIALFNNNVSRIATLHSRTLEITDEATSSQSSAELDELVGKTRQLSNDLKEKIQSLSSFPVTRPQDQAIRKNQTSLLRQKFVEVLQAYQGVEREYRQKYRQRVERQFKIVKPDASPEEIAAVVNDTGSGNQIFTQAVYSIQFQRTCHKLTARR